MKTAISLFVFLVLSVHVTRASGNPDLVREIKAKINVDLSSIELNRYKQDYVTVSFRIIEGEIKILEIGGTHKELKAIMIKELNQIHVDAPYENGKTYVYRFTFEKI